MRNLNQKDLWMGAVLYPAVLFVAILSIGLIWVFSAFLTMWIWNFFMEFLHGPGMNVWGGLALNILLWVIARTFWVRKAEDY